MSHPWLEICKLIIENIADKNPADYDGNTPLHLAANTPIYNAPSIDYEHLNTCRLILENVGDKNPANNLGKTPKDLARNKEILTLFEEAESIEERLD